MTMQYAAPDPSGLPELDISGMIAALKAAGYSVRKARARKVYDASGTEIEPRTCVHCGAPSAHVARIGPAKRKRDRTEVGVCADCYRFGPGLHAIPHRPENPEHARRLYMTWRRAHHRFARRRQAGMHDAPTGRTEQYVVHYGVREDTAEERPMYWHPIKEADALTEAIKAAMQNAPMVRDYAPSKIPGQRVMRGEAVAA